MKRLLSFLSMGYVVYAAVTLGFVVHFFWRVYSAHSAGDEQAPEMQWAALVTFGFVTITLIVMFVVLGWMLAKRRHRRAAMIIAGISCLGIPVGTILGALTLYALTRPEVVTEFSERT